ncbi:MAG: NAD(P)H-hydrate dehydratase [Gammaproteobacteria bacterium]|nr:NAD(P)H-hydrate dehydratase [Gammaproteobacteria bacterium]
MSNFQASTIVESRVTHQPQLLYSASAMGELDRRVAVAQHISSLTLMKRAGRAAFDALLRRWPKVQRVQVFCGGGNNGGDGYIVAGLCAGRQLPVTVYSCVAVEHLKGDALEAYHFAKREGARIVTELKSLEAIDEHTVCVDALLGTGFHGTLRRSSVAAIVHINNSAAPVMAIDLPSGLNADTGHAAQAVQADMTVTFIGRKFGLHTGRGPALAGEVVFAGLDAPQSVYTDVMPLAKAYGGHNIERLPARSADSYKNQFGRVLVVGGDHGFGGAVLMAAEAAARAGAGLIELASRPEHVPAALMRRPEIMAHAVISGQELEPLLQGPDVIAVGPGLGSAPWGEQLLARVGRAALPLVMDADALNILAAGRVLAGVRRSDWVLTPHVGEAARLLACDTAAISHDRRAAAQAMQQKYGGVVILKGAGTLIAHEDGIDVINCGNPGMASGGMGDLLTGIIAALIGQKMDILAAARLAVWLHGEAGNRAAVDGQRGLLASDLLPWIRRLVD